jgi:hypothetical protein
MSVVMLSEDHLRNLAQQAAMRLCETVPKGYSVCVVICRPDEVLGLATNQENRNISGFLRRVADLILRGPVTSLASEPIRRQ